MEYLVFIVIGALVLLGSAIGSIAGNMLASELYDRAPLFAVSLIEHAVKRLPEHEQERYREEWLAHLNEHHGKLGKVWHALGCVVGRALVAQALASDQRLKSRKSDEEDWTHYHELKDLGDIDIRIELTHPSGVRAEAVQYYKKAYEGLLKEFESKASERPD